MATQTAGKAVDSQSTGDRPGRRAGTRTKGGAGPHPCPKGEVRRASLAFKQIGDSTRLWILLILAQGERNVGALCREMDDIPQSACSHHLAMLRFGGLVESRRDGRRNFYGLTSTGQALVDVAWRIVEDAC